MDPDAVSEDNYSLQAPTRMHTGERLAQDLEFLEQNGLSRQASFTCSTAQDNLLPQLLEHFNQMVQNGRFQFPPIPQEQLQPTMPLNENTPNRELRQLFASLPFRFLHVGNHSQGDPSLSVDTKISFTSFQYQCLRRTLSRTTIQHPTSPETVDGLILNCKSNLKVFSTSLF
jgi:hypothetical protein